MKTMSLPQARKIEVEDKGEKTRKLLPKTLSDRLTDQPIEQPTDQLIVDHPWFYKNMEETAAS
jgi:hypothetical protein